MTFCLTCQYDTKYLPNGNCSGCGNVNDYSTSLKEAVVKYRDLGLSVIPNRPITKHPAFGKGEYHPYFQKYCDVDPAPDGNVGVMTGAPSGGMIGFDDDSFIDAFLTLLPEYRESTLCTKSGMKGGVALFRMDNPPDSFDLKKEFEIEGKIVERDIQFFSKDKQIVMPPSIHPDTKKQYQLLHDNPIKKITREEFDHIIKVLNDNGWKGSTKKTDNGFKIKKPIAEKIENLKTKGVGSNRGGDLLSLARSRNRKTPLELVTERSCTDAIREFNDALAEPKSEDEIIALGKQVYEYRLKQDTGDIDVAKEVTEIIKVAKDLLERYDKKEALKKFLELDLGKQDTELKVFFKKAEKEVKKNIEFALAPNNEGDNPTMNIFHVGKGLIDDAIRSAKDTEQIVIKIILHGKYHWIDIHSPTFNQLIRINYQRDYSEIESDSTYVTAIKNLHAELFLNGETTIKDVFNRCALIDGSLYYDLQNEDGEIVRITSENIDDDPEETAPIFLKSPSAKTIHTIQKQPKYDDPQALDDLITLFRIPEEDKVIFKSHLISLFLTDIPIPVMIFHGNQGSAKTSVSSGVKKIIDPEGENAMSLPEKIDDLAIILSRHDISNFDNLDTFSKEISHFFSKAVTGTSYAKRTLFTTAEEFTINLMSKIILNGISPSVNQPDLVERSIFYELPIITGESRLTDEEFDETFNSLIPNVLGIIFNIIKDSISLFDDVKSELKKNKTMPRMASFSVWGETFARASGAENNAFIKRYNQKIDASNLSLTEEYPAIEPLLTYFKRKFADSTKSFDVAISKLFDGTIGYGHNDDRMPKDPASLGKQLKSVASIFKSMGYDIKSKKYQSRDGHYPRGSTVVTVTKTEWYDTSNDTSDTSSKTNASSTEKAKTGMKLGDF